MLFRSPGWGRLACSRFGFGAMGGSLQGKYSWGCEMVASAGFAEFLGEMLAPLGAVSMRRMFGKTGVFCRGVMFGMVADDVFYVRVDGGNRALFAEASGAAPLNYVKAGKVIDLAFWPVPERLLDAPDELLVWARAALGAAARIAGRRGGGGGGFEP